MSNLVVEREIGMSVRARSISWGAIIAGTILTLVVQVMLGLLGIGIGLSALDPVQEGPSLATLSSTTGIWTIATIVIATFIGAYAAARLAGCLFKRDGALHGITSWALSTLVVVYLLTSGVSAVLTSTLGAVGGTISTLTEAAVSATPGSLEALPPALREEARELLAPGEEAAPEAASPPATDAPAAAQQEPQPALEGAADAARQAAGTQDLGAAVGEIFAGLQADASPEQRAAAVSVISSQAGIPEAEAEQRLTAFQGRYDEVVAQAREAAAGAADTLSATAFAAFAAMLFGLVVAAVGGIAGRVRPRSLAHE